MNRLIAGSAVLLVVLTSCGGGAAPSPSPTELAQVSPTPVVTTAAPSTPAPAPTPFNCPKLMPNSSVEINEQFVKFCMVGISKEDWAKLEAAMTRETYQFIDPIDHSKDTGRVKAQLFTSRPDAQGSTRTWSSFIPIDGKVTVLAHAAAESLIGSRQYSTADGPEKVYVFDPFDRDNPFPCPPPLPQGQNCYQSGSGKGADLLLSGDAKLLISTNAAVYNTGGHIGIQIGVPLAEVDVTTAPIKTYAGNAAIVIVGSATAAPAKTLSVLNKDSWYQKDGKLAYLKTS